MNKDELRALQAPLKERYLSDPDAARTVLRAVGTVDLTSIGCRVELLPHDEHGIIAGLHPMAGGDGSKACSGELLLQALVTCAGTTLAAVATAMSVEVRAATIVAEGTLDFRGTLGVDRSAPVGLTGISLQLQIESKTPRDQLDKLAQLTERYCVVARTLAAGVPISTRLTVSSTSG